VRLAVIEEELLMEDGGSDGDEVSVVGCGDNVDILASSLLNASELE
jgi:hypothetical protein